MGDMTRGIVRENPIFVTAVGLCPSLAVTSHFSSAFALSVILLLVLLATAVSVSLLNRIVLKPMQVVVGVAITATFVTIADVLVSVHLPLLSAQLGIYLPLLAVNGVILSQAHHVAWRHGVGRSVLDSFGRGVGFLIGLSAVALIREPIGFGTLTLWPWGDTSGTLQVPAVNESPLLVIGSSVGAFMVVAYIKAIMNYRATKRAEKNEEARA